MMYPEIDKHLGLKEVIIKNDIMGLIVVETGTILYTPDICCVIINLHVLGAKGVERNVCEIVGRHGLGRAKSAIGTNAKCEAFEVLGSWMSRLIMWQLGLGEKIFVAEDESQLDDRIVL